MGSMFPIYFLEWDFYYLSKSRAKWSHTISTLSRLQTEIPQCSNLKFQLPKVTEMVKLGQLCTMCGHSVSLFSFLHWSLFSLIGLLCNLNHNHQRKSLLAIWSLSINKILSQTKNCKHKYQALQLSTCCKKKLITKQSKVTPNDLVNHILKLYKNLTSFIFPDTQRTINREKKQNGLTNSVRLPHSIV